MRRWPATSQEGHSHQKLNPQEPFSYTSSLQKSEKINVLFKPPGLWYFVMAAQADQYTKEVISCVDSESLNDVEQGLGQCYPLSLRFVPFTSRMTLDNGIRNAGMKRAWYWAWHVIGTIWTLVFML